MTYHKPHGSFNNGNSNGHSQSEDDTITLHQHYNNRSSTSTTDSSSDLLHRHNSTSKTSIPFTYTTNTTTTTVPSPCTQCGSTTSTNNYIYLNERHLVTPAYKFSGLQDPVEWLMMYQETALANNWSPRAMLNILPVYIEPLSTARTWFRENRELWENEERDEDKLEMFSEAFVRRFEKTNSATAG
ncbi:hypothetical protein EC991_004119 [Linnemannia zychae]|nr:hypothetical protein EC991_004119 [Linnemannia zychae]